MRINEKIPRGVDGLPLVKSPRVGEGVAGLPDEIYPEEIEPVRSSRKAMVGIARILQLSQEHPHLPVPVNELVNELSDLASALSPIAKVKDPTKSTVESYSRRNERDTPPPYMPAPPCSTL